MADAVVHVGPGMQLAAEYYQRCSFDVAGPGRITTGQIINFTNLEQLLDNIASRTEVMHLIVSHGSTTNGLIIPFAQNTSFNATGLIISNLAQLAKSSVPLLAQNKHLPVSDTTVINLASMMGIQPNVAIRLAEKFIAVQEKKPIIFIRGCNIGGNQPMLLEYKAALGAQMISAPKCRMFFLRIQPHLPTRRQTMAGLGTGRPTTANTRRRFFKQPAGGTFSSAMIIDVRDIDGHTKVDNESFQSATDPSNAWAKEFNFAWNGGLPNQFIMPVMWDNAETSYHCPNDISYREKLVFV
ncbi:hypothetical protein [Dyadobacter luticola]|uniref:Uncharacterized protein n=1 Tax=Dyadobacter luticola TaxID=1979387 RepID=A0A5R9KNZ9_9BACT|nr:hypothetical protein [Dyadobacter luticola]TLU98011.1 hypothetical protein FEN17_24800 [Dyadobacter luticola]